MIYLKNTVTRKDKPKGKAQKKNPGQLNRPGLTAGLMLMPSGFAKER